MGDAAETRLGVDSRRAEILDRIRVERHARTEELARHFGVSRMTIHRALEQLAEAGKLERIRGGARAIEEEFTERDVVIRRATNTAVKSALAQEVGTLIGEGDVVALDDSTTVEACLPFVLAAQPSGIITHSLKLMTVVSKSTPHLVLTGVGGRYVAATDSFLGTATCRAVDRLHASVTVVSTTCINGTGIYHPDEDAAITKASFVKLGARKILVLDSSKFLNFGMHFVASLASFDDIVIDSNLSTAQSEQLRESGARIHLVDTPAPEPTLPTAAILK